MSRQKSESDRLLERAYALETPDEGRLLYRDWADSYDRHLKEGLRYVGPASVARLLADSVSERGVPVLDVGCGTGLVAECLAPYGFGLVDGLDFSPEMLRVAEGKGVYRQLFEEDLNQSIGLASGSYDAAISCGTFTHGHVSASALDEILRLLKPGAHFAFTVHRDVWEALGFEGKLPELQGRGAISGFDFSDQPYFEGKEPEGRYCLLRRV